ncbi:glycosyltransferase [Falsiroseomonas sp. CW058]|uniref:glycosyltransferase n=1 Tax=Falsiroseomonas sp. CW058 TaxID=3388664 RepID=UPI003D3172BB
MASPRRRAAAASKPLRVLVMSHMHPAVSKGGAEIAAYQMHKAFGARPGVHSTFLAASGGKVQERLGARFVQPFGPDEWVYSGAGFDHWIHANPDPEFPTEFTALLREVAPDVVHLHHYTNFGVETLLHIRRALPDATVLVTLHEYLGICNHFGQMVKRPTLNLCERASPRDCARCFPERTEQDFFLRDMYIRRFFGLVDHFVSPSRFLAQRYVAWGIDGRRMSVIENGMPEHGLPPAEPPRPDPEDGVVLGFFGQISRLKGIDVLLDAAEMLDRQEVTGLRIDIHGDYSGQPPAFRELFEQRLAKLPPNVRHCGPYENRRVHQLMRSVQGVLVPSIWWENSPLVIQEALLNRRPVITSDIGGMAEKVRDGLDGFHFQAGSAFALANLLRGLARDPRRLAALQDSMATPPSVGDTANAALKLYRRLMAARTTQEIAA